MNERVLYEHRQTGWVVLIGMGVALLVLAAAAAYAGDGEATRVFPFIVFGLVVTTVLFSSMTVRVTSQHVEWWFGVRALGRKIPLSEIVSVSQVRTTILEGWGIHLTWHGWVWNVSGTSAIQVLLRSGTRFAVGTPEPAEVVAAIENAKAGAA